MTITIFPIFFLLFTKGDSVLETTSHKYKEKVTWINFGLEAKHLEEENMKVSIARLNQSLGTYSPFDTQASPDSRLWETCGQSWTRKWWAPNFKYTTAQQWHFPLCHSTDPCALCLSSLNSSLQCGFNENKAVGSSMTWKGSNQIFIMWAIYKHKGNMLLFISVQFTYSIKCLSIYTLRKWKIIFCKSILIKIFRCLFIKFIGSLSSLWIVILQLSNIFSSLQSFKNTFTSLEASVFLSRVLWWKPNNCYFLRKMDHFLSL